MSVHPSSINQNYFNTLFQATWMTIFFCPYILNKLSICAQKEPNPANMGPAVPYLTVAYFMSVYKIFPAIATGTSSWNYSIFHAWSILPYKLIYFPSDKRLQKISWWHLSLKHGISNDSLFHGIVDTAIKNRCALCNSC